MDSHRELPITNTSPIFVPFILAATEPQPDFFRRLQSYTNRPFDSITSVLERMPKDEALRFSEAWENAVNNLKEALIKINIQLPLEKENLDRLNSLHDTLATLVRPLLNELIERLNLEATVDTTHEELQKVLHTLASAYAFHLFTDARPVCGELTERQKRVDFQQFGRKICNLLFISGNLKDNFLEQIKNHFSIRSTLNKEAFNTLRRIAGVELSESAFFLGLRAKASTFLLLELFSIYNEMLAEDVLTSPDIRARIHHLLNDSIEVHLETNKSNLTALIEVISYPHSNRDFERYKQTALSSIYTRINKKIGEEYFLVWQPDYAKQILAAIKSCKGEALEPHCEHIFEMLKIIFKDSEDRQLRKMLKLPKLKNEHSFSSEGKLKLFAKFSQRMRRSTSLPASCSHSNSTPTRYSFFAQSHFLSSEIRFHNLNIGNHRMRNRMAEEEKYRVPQRSIHK